ncbi:MAG: ABC transporter permease subunit [Chloroflexi bacterium]|nr:ABC transporter permease subunit [Chloroflexota bacterium]
MLDLFRAEWKKATGNRLLVGCTVWIFPILGCGALSLFTIILLASSGSRQDFINEPPRWDDIGVGVWGIANFPISRLFLISFAATLFAGEYQYQTLKSVLPGNRRLELIVTKFMAMTAFIVITFVATIFILVIGFGLICLLFGADYPPAVTGSTVAEFLKDLLLNASITFASTLIFAGIAALVSILTRSILFGVMASVFLTLIESFGLILVLALIAAITHLDVITDLYLLTPTYNSGNILQWVNDNSAAPPILEGRATLSLSESVIILGFWIISMVGLSILAFQRQDIQ